MLLRQPWCCSGICLSCDEPPKIVSCSIVAGLNENCLTSNSQVFKEGEASRKEMREK